MGFYDNKDNVLQYIEMSRDYSGRSLIEVLASHLEKGASLLELGMGPGKDLDSLGKIYDVTGSDSSEVFLDIYREHNNNANLILLDAITINTSNKYDCIYSNKVLQHLTTDELSQSITRQYDKLNSNGLVFHTFWYGEGTEVYNDLRFVYYKEDILADLFTNKFKVIEINRYQEEEEGDSIYLIARKS
ncbi:hypothetical protein AN1V17_15940 [Vallitalea sediminicola]